MIDLLDAAVAAGLLDESPTVPGRYSFGTPCSAAPWRRNWG